ncbi:hypothetical protein GC167_10630 [bacterium]|nr:hypothetical protein [bacterium]
MLPIMGDAVAERGIGLPLPFGVMANGFSGIQYLQLTGLKVGFGSSELIPLDDIVQFEEVSALANSPNIRLDAWLFPFLNVYAIGGYGVSEVRLKMSSPFPLETQTTSSGGFAGFGILAAGAYQDWMFSLDFNHQWVFTDKLDQPAELAISGFRTGPIFRSITHNDRNWVVWTGVMRTSLNSETVGQISMDEVFPDLDQTVGGYIDGLDAWYDGLSPVKQALYEGPYNALRGQLENAEMAADDGIIRYQMQKTIPNPWNLLVGVQFQLDPRWQFRAEYQGLGDREGTLLSVNYRFGIKGKTLLGQ